MARGARTAAYLGVTAMTIWRWERDPKLAFPRASVIHGRKYWNRNDIDAWMRRMAIQGDRDRQSRRRRPPLKWEPVVIDRSKSPTASCSPPTAIDVCTSASRAGIGRIG